ncbi:MAG: efflux transporter outer membrane subunit, partial [Candidatus Binatia bacterium]
DETLYTLGLSAGWEVDVFGRVRRSVESAGATVEASEEDHRDVLVALCAEVARAYVNVRTLQNRLKVAYVNLDSQAATVELTRVRLDGGVASGLDVAQAESVLASTRTTIPSVERELLQELNRLSVLLGENPGSVLVELADGGRIPVPPAALTVGFPAEVVRQRPDIRRAERELAAQTARIGIASADLYPRFTLLGSFAFDATHVSDLFTGSSRAYSVGPAVRWNVFDAGRIRGLIRAEEARAVQALAHYEQTVLRGLEEVESALVAYARLREERQAVGDAVRAAAFSLELATELYKDGLVDFQNVLDAQRTVLEFEDQLAVTDGAMVQSVVQLYRALGGGWKAVAANRSAAQARNG